MIHYFKTNQSLILIVKINTSLKYRLRIAPSKVMPTLFERSYAKLRGAIQRGTVKTTPFRLRTLNGYLNDLSMETKLKHDCDGLKKILKYGVLSNGYQFNFI